MNEALVGMYSLRRMIVNKKDTRKRENNTGIKFYMHIIKKKNSLTSYTDWNAPAQLSPRKSLFDPLN